MPKVNGALSSNFSLGMKDSLGPLKALVVASVVNGLGHVVLCNFLHYGITGAAWATMASQVYMISISIVTTYNLTHLSYCMANFLDPIIYRHSILPLNH